jgi:type II secretory pathway pseudopilin PulG
MYKKFSDYCLNNKGMTVAEILVVVAIVTVIGLAISTFARDLFMYSGTVQSNLSAQQDARQMLRQFASELRVASQSSTGTYPISEASDTAITFYSDINGDGIKDRVRYYVSGNMIKKDVLVPTGLPLAYTGTPATSIVMRDLSVTTGIFSYYDKNYTGTSAPLGSPVDVSSVRLVKMNITIDRDPNRSPTPINVTTQVVIRNLKDNL